MGFETNANYCPWSQDLGPNEPALTDRALNGLQRVLEGGHCGGQGMGQAVSGIGAIGMHERFECYRADLPGSACDAVATLNHL